MAVHFGGRLVEGGDVREAVLERMQTNLPGFPVERYAAELDAALARIDEAQVGVMARREQLIAEARRRDRLNAVFTIRYFNRRFSGHVGECGLGRIDLVDALGDLYPREQVTEAALRADALIDEGLRRGYGSWDHEPNMARLRRAHPGLDDRALSHALDWGHLIGRRGAACLVPDADVADMPAPPTTARTGQGRPGVRGYARPGQAYFAWLCGVPRRPPSSNTGTASAQDVLLRRCGSPPATAEHVVRTSDEAGSFPIHASGAAEGSPTWAGAAGTGPERCPFQDAPGPDLNPGRHGAVDDPAGTRTW